MINVNYKIWWMVGKGTYTETKTSLDEQLDLNFKWRGFNEESQSQSQSSRGQDNLVDLSDAGQRVFSEVHVD